MPVMVTTASDLGPLERLRQLDTCAISDALDTLVLSGATTELMPLWPVPHVVVGRALTVTAGPRQSDRPAAHIAASAIDVADAEDVLVIANQGRLDVSCWGGILARAAVHRGVRGVIVDGACRDIGESEELRFPVFGRAVVPVSARGRIVQLATQEPVEVAGTVVHPGDLVLADRNGVVFVPQGKVDVVLELAERIQERENNMVAAVRTRANLT